MGLGFVSLSAPLLLRLLPPHQRRLRIIYYLKTKLDKRRSATVARAYRRGGTPGQVQQQRLMRCSAAYQPSVFPLGEIKYLPLMSSSMRGTAPWPVERRLSRLIAARRSVQGTPTSQGLTGRVSERQRTCDESSSSQSSTGFQEGETSRSQKSCCCQLISLFLRTGSLDLLLRHLLDLIKLR